MDDGKLNPVNGVHSGEESWAGSLSDLIAKLPVGVFEEDVEAGNTLVNEQLLAFAGISAEDAAELGWMSAIHPDDKDRVISQWIDVTSRLEVVCLSFRFLKPDGTVVWVKVQAIPRFDKDGQILGYLGTTTDITRIKETEEELRGSVHHLKETLDDFPGVIFRVFCSPSRIELMYLSQGVEQLTGISRMEVTMATPKQQMAWVHPEDRDRVLSARSKLLAGQKYWERIRLFRPDGSLYWTDVRISVVESRGGGVLCEGMAIDITEEMDEGRVVQRREQEPLQLERQMQEARKLETLGRLAGGIAHDFNNLLGAILGFAQFVAEDVGEGHAAYRNAGLILDAADRGKEMVAQILAFARQTGTVRRRFRLEEVVTETDALIRVAVPASITIDILAEATGLMVEADRIQLGQVLLNLCMNARDALEGDVGRISIQVEAMSRSSPWLSKLAGRVPGSAATVDVWTEADNMIVGMVGTADMDKPYVALLVSDNGVGMEMGQVARIFDPFFTTKDLGKGTGLGLSVVHSIVLDLDGAIVIRSRPGFGTEIRIILPGYPVEGEVVQEQAEIVHDVVAGRVMVVDDDENFGDMLAQLMERRGWDVAFFSSPLAAAEAFKANPGRWDLVITDQIMPNLWGQDLIVRIKALNPAVPCILCTGYDETVSENSAKLHGASELLYKPMTAKQLLAAVALAMNSVKS